MPMDEPTLIQRSRQGDLDAFNRLVESYQSQVFNLAWRMLGSPAGAEDAAQEAFISAYRNISSYRGGSFRAWLLRIAVNACYDQLRTSKRHSGPSLDALLETPSFQPPSKDPSPESLALSAELSAAIQQAIAALPEDQRSVLVLVDVEGLAYEEVAQAAGVNIGTVKSRLSRARARVRDLLAAHRELLPDRYRLPK
ncbi:MAG: sigma-70 family RNA polymerase sigma factor [Dehalococcoidia bacterium]|nr:sigma-70 family RNA polymerase sigma factor [Dehalococcoidia bacterium]